MKIALTFSGGGYRAAAFSLGTLSFLDKLVLDEKPFLESIKVLSTVSGGTITGARYAVGLKRGEKFHVIYKSLVDFMSDSKLVKDALERLSSKENWPEGRVRSLVTSFADIYDSHLFDHEKFSILMDEENNGIAHLSFNATEFANALQFRFQWTGKIIDPEPDENPRGIIGNNFYRVPPSVAKEIRMGDIMAASSCFPGGFEPINFPSDFVMPTNAVKELSTGKGYPVGLMDGGIVDNQGIRPVILARDRMFRNHIKANGDPQITNLLDLILISDVASPYMKQFQASHQNRKGWWKSLTPKLILWLNSLLLIGSLVLVVQSVRKELVWGAAVGGAFTAITLVLFWLFRIVGSSVKGAGIPPEFLKPISKLLKIKLYVYQSLLLNRVNSLLMLSMDIFLKHVRRLNYESLYSDKDFKNRMIMSAIYELRNDEIKIGKKVASGRLPAYLLPSKLVLANSDLASSMGTTLWFTEQELEQGMLEAIIACGQYTACWNLLEYIQEIKADRANTTQAHQHLIDLEPSLKQYWNDFQTDPLRLVR